MEKISGIIPSSPRVKAVDLKAARPVRPGTPSFGAPEGSSSLKDQVTLSGITMQNPNSIEVPRWKSKEDSQAEIVNRITNQFFKKSADAPARGQQPEFPTYSPQTLVAPYVGVNDVRINDYMNENQRVAQGFEEQLNEASDGSASQSLVDSRNENMAEVAAQRKAGYVKADEADIIDNGFLDMVA